MSWGEKVGILKVRLFRPFSVAAFAAALPKTVRALAVRALSEEGALSGRSWVAPQGGNPTRRSRSAKRGSEWRESNAGSVLMYVNHGVRSA